MKRSILTLLVAFVLAAQHADAQIGVAAASPQATSASGRSFGNDFAPSRSNDFSPVESRSYSASGSSSYSESPISRSGASNAFGAEDRFSGTGHYRNYSPSYSHSFSDKNNLVSSYTNNYYTNVKSGGFTGSLVTAASISSYGGCTGVSSSVKTDTSGSCQPWSPLMRWLVYRRHQRQGIDYRLPPEFALSMFDPSPAFIADVQDYITTDERSPDMFTFFDGYIVFCHDTAYGLINLTADGVYFDGGDLQLKVPYKYRGLKAVVLYNDRNEELYLKRIGNDKILSRVLHNGKLVIYDCYYSFDKSNFSYTSLSAAYRNKEQRPLVLLDQRLNMIRTINRVYGSKLPTNYDWSYIVQHINTLD